MFAVDDGVDYGIDLCMANCGMGPFLLALCALCSDCDWWKWSFWSCVLCVGGLGWWEWPFWPCMLCVGVLVWWEWSSLFVIVCSVWVAVGEDCVFGTPLPPPPLAAWLAVCRPCPVLGPREQYRPIAVQGEWRGSAGLGPTPLFSGDDGHSFGPFLILVSKLHCPKVPKLHCPKVPKLHCPKVPLIQL